jgi:uncharacterized membrane protein
VLLTPLAFPVFVVVAVFGRLRGRLGIESRWAGAGRWYLLAGVVLAVVAAALAVSQVQVPGRLVPRRCCPRRRRLRLGGARLLPPIA